MILLFFSRPLYRTVIGRKWARMHACSCKIQMAWTRLPLQFFFLFYFYSTSKKMTIIVLTLVREENKHWINGWMDGVLSSVSFFYVVSACMCVYFYFLVHRNSPTHAHTLTHTKRNKERETKEQDEKSCTHSWWMNLTSQPTDADANRSKHVDSYIIRRIMEEEGRGRGQNHKA